jgi:hypothetical protein
LAFLATFCLAGMFLLSLGSSGEFGEADKEAVRAVTEAGVAALEADIQAAPVQRAPMLAFDPRLADAMARDPDDEDDLAPDELPLAQALTEVSEQLRVRTDSNMTVAVVEPSGAIAAASGVAESHLHELVSSSAYQSVGTDEATSFTVLLNGEVHVAKVSEVLDHGRRLVAVEALDTGVASLLRRVLGTSTPAGLVRKGELLGGVLGNQSVAAELIQLAEEHHADVPNQGASRTFMVGSGLDARIGALGRVPGPAGQGKSGAMIVVLSRSTAAARQRDLAQALRSAQDRGSLGDVSWLWLAGVLVVSAGLAIYLPRIEALGPLRRLTRELDAVAQGAQHHIFHDRYSGAAGEVARAAVTAQEALRQAFLAELDIDSSSAVDDYATAPREKPRTIRQRRLTRAHKRLEEASSSGARPVDPLAPHRAVPSGSNPFPLSDLEGALGGAPKLPTPAPSQSSGSWRSASTPSRPPMGASGGASGSSASRPPPRPASTRPPSSRRTSPPPSRPQARPPAVPPRPPDPGPRSTTRPPSAPSVPVSPPPPSESNASGAQYREIYDEFLQVKAACGESIQGLTLDRFAAKLRKNTRDLKEARPGIKDVQFTVYVKDGKAALKAKVVK